MNAMENLITRYQRVIQMMALFGAASSKTLLFDQVFILIGLSAT